jgi:hypothetical protein
MLAGAVRFVTGRLHADGPGLMPGYTVDGEPIQQERAVPLPGFPGGKPRTGNLTAGAGRTPGSPACPGCARSPGRPGT